MPLKPSNLAPRALGLNYERRSKAGNVAIDEDEQGVSIHVTHASEGSARPLGAALMSLSALFSFAPLYLLWRDWPDFEREVLWMLGGAAGFALLGVTAFISWAPRPSTFVANGDGLQVDDGVFDLSSAWPREEIVDVLAGPLPEQAFVSVTGFHLLALRLADGSVAPIWSGQPADVERMAAALRRGLGIEARAAGGGPRHAPLRDSGDSD